MGTQRVPTAFLSTCGVQADKLEGMIEIYKAAFDHARDVHHFNNAGIAPWSQPTLSAVTHWASKLATGGTTAVGLAIEETEKTRAKLARFIGTKPEQVAFFTTCATAISQVALGFPFQFGDEILVWDQEYPSNFHPWRVAADRSGAKLVIAKSDSTLATPFETLVKSVTPKTRVIAVSWVQFRSGAQTDLKALAAFARERGIFTCIDVIQGLGALPFDFDSSGLDAVCGGAHKWLSSPLSLGFLILRQEHVELLKPIMVGAMSYGGPDIPSSTDVKMVRGMPKYEPGGRQILEMVGLGATLDLYEQVGIAAISTEAERLANLLADGLKANGYVVNSPHGTRISGAILNVSPSSSSACKTIEEMEARLHALKVTFSRRPPGIRLSPHASLRDEQIKILVEGLAQA